MQPALHAPGPDPCCRCARRLWPIRTPHMPKSRLIGVVVRLASTLGLPLTGLALPEDSNQTGEAR